jgi:O-antigen/teichoic acid export membrane protein
MVQAGQFFLQFLLARILGPEIFGLGARLIAVGSILDRASEFGFSAAVVQREELEERHRSTAFFMNLGLAVVVGVGGLLVVRLHASLTGWTPFLEVLQFSVFLPLAMALGHVQRALLIRKLDYRTQSLAQAAAMVAYLGVGTGMALAGLGVWSILGGFASNYAVLAAIFWIVSDWRPSWLIRKDALRELFGFGVYIALARAMFDLSKYMPVLLIGAVLGDVRAGLFSIAFKVGYATVSQVVSVLSSVLFSSFSRLQNDEEGLRGAYLESLRYMAVLSLIPVVVAYGAVPVLPPLLGDEWAEIVDLARILCFASIWWGLGAELMPPILAGAGKPSLRFLAGTVTVVGLTTALLIGMRYDLVGACIATAIFYALNNVFYQWLIVRTVKTSLWEVGRRIWDPFVAFCLAAAAIHGLERYVVGDGLVWTFGGAILAATVGVAVYAGTVHLADRRILRDLAGTLRRMIASRAARSG